MVTSCPHDEPFMLMCSIAASRHTAHAFQWFIDIYLRLVRFTFWEFNSMDWGVEKKTIFLASLTRAIMPYSIFIVAFKLTAWREIQNQLIYNKINNELLQLNLVWCPLGTFSSCKQQACQLWEGWCKSRTGHDHFGTLGETLSPCIFTIILMAEMERITIWLLM